MTSLGQGAVGAVAQTGDDAVLVDVRVDVRSIDEDQATTTMMMMMMMLVSGH